MLKLSKESLKQRNPQLYAKFGSVWDIRRRHMVHGLPSQYIFMLICCFEPGCSHPLCLKGKPDSIPTWYKEKPPITHLPLPFEDEERPWGSSSCSKCSGFCAGQSLGNSYRLAYCKAIVYRFHGEGQSWGTVTG